MFLFNFLFFPQLVFIFLRFLLLYLYPEASISCYFFFFLVYLDLYSLFILLLPSVSFHILPFPFSLCHVLFLLISFIMITLKVLKPYFYAGSFTHISLYSCFPFLSMLRFLPLISFFTISAFLSLCLPSFLFRPTFRSILQQFPFPSLGADRMNGGF